MVGIVSYGAYLPRLRLDRMSIMMSMGWLAPGLITATILTFIFSWNEFVFAVVLTRRHAITAPVAITKYVAYEGLEWGSLAAGGVCMLIPVVVISGLIRKYMVRGLMSGAVKG